ncbi:MULTISPECIES: hypothetical protein [Streptomyces]|uniref:hypothetical protein n=1 Tax=Streptomyces TaxID=1883 RepID=UPI002930102E|nr:hypothetical protein [Streptomyces sp. NEAU-HV9]
MFDVEQTTPYEVKLIAAGKTATITDEPIVNRADHWEFAVYRADVAHWDDGRPLSADERACILQILSERGTRLD